MSLSLLTALLLSQAQAGVAAAKMPPFAAAQAVAESNRIAVTPKINGKLDEEEWDPLASDAATKTFFQWEPGRLHAAAAVPNGEDMVVSIDARGNGWLIGSDNLEIRVGSKDGKTTFAARL